MVDFPFLLCPCLRVTSLSAAMAKRCGPTDKLSGLEMASRGAEQHAADENARLPSGRIAYFQPFRVR